MYAPQLQTNTVFVANNAKKKRQYGGLWLYAATEFVPAHKTLAHLKSSIGLGTM